MKIRISLLLLGLITLLFSCSSGSPDKKPGEQEVKAQIKFSDNIYDFGKIEFGSDGRCYFEFSNISSTDLVINNVRTSCGCTRPEWPHEPIAPGETGKIGVTYNTKITGRFAKTITVYSNSEYSPHKLYVRGTVAEEKTEKTTQ